MSKKFVTGNMIWCEICCCQLNTAKMLEIHKESPNHKKKEEALVEVMQMKHEYLKKREESENVNGPTANA